MSLADELASEEYIRERLYPKCGDWDYLCLSDLLESLRLMADLDAQKVLDYGCGGSPYKSMFSSGTYHRADLAGDPSLDYSYGSDSRLPNTLGDYDFVLSSQVLEHVLDPKFYLSECLRVLKPGGRLLVTTHGIYPDHASPHDYWRWTIFGLSKEIEAAGFEVLQIKKLTTGARAALFLLERFLSVKPRFQDSGIYGLVVAQTFRLFRRFGRIQRHRMADTALGHCRIVEVTSENVSDKHPLYIGVAVLARKPM